MNAADRPRRRRWRCARRSRNYSGWGIPLALAPMGGSAGGALAAAVSNAGGLGLLGGGNGDRDWLARKLPIVGPAARARPWGVGFQSWAVEQGHGRAGA